MSKAYLYTNRRIDVCRICKYHDCSPVKPPCKGCKHRVHPREPVEELWIENNKYVLAERNKE